MAEAMGGWARVRLGLVVITLLVLHTSLFNQLRVFGVMVDVMLLVAVAAGLVRGSALGAQVGFAAGLATDLFLNTPMGLSALVFSLVGYATGIVATGLATTTRLLTMAIAAGASATGVVVFALVGTMLGSTGLLTGRLWVVVFVVAVGNGFLSPLAVRLLRWAVSAGHRARAFA